MDFSWLNESELKREEEGKLVIYAPAGHGRSGQLGKKLL